LLVPANRSITRRGAFYPDRPTQAKELEYAASQLTSVEIDGTDSQRGARLIGLKPILSLETFGPLPVPMASDLWNKKKANRPASPNSREKIRTEWKYGILRFREVLHTGIVDYPSARASVYRVPIPSEPG